MLILSQGTSVKNICYSCGVYTPAIPSNRSEGTLEVMAIAQPQIKFFPLENCKMTIKHKAFLILN